MNLNEIKLAKLWKTVTDAIEPLDEVLSLVFICRENPRRSAISLFPDRPRFSRLMKTENRRYPRSSGMNGDKSGESERFYFPDASQISALVGDHSRQMETQILTVGDVEVRRQ